MAFPKLSLFRRRKAPVDAGPDATIIVDRIPPAEEKKGTKIPLIGGKPLQQQLRILGITLGVVLFMAFILVVLENRETGHDTAYASAAGQMRMLSQRLAKASQQALQGNSPFFREVQTSRETFAKLLSATTKGGDIDGTSVPGEPSGSADILPALISEWDKTDRNVAMLLQQEKNLLTLGKAVNDINAKNPHFLELSEQITALKLQSGASAKEIAAASQLVMLSQRLAKNANALLVADAIDPEAAFLLGKDTNSFRDGLANLNAMTADGDTKQKLADLETAFKEYQDAVSGILSNMQSLVQAKEAGSRIIKQSNTLFDASDKLEKQINNDLRGRFLTTVLVGVMVVLAVGVLLLILVVVREDANLRREEAEEQRRRAESEKDANQQAILRLMNEMGDLADGDLTVRATVTEDVTGAIADSVNYTIEELSVLVKRINDAASRVTRAAETAQRTSDELLAATERQAVEIQEAGQAVLHMAESMNQVSASAAQSAQVARLSLESAQKGSFAVENSIKGMNEIRDQIQETSKRIKRLGESSQEIGEIVELISDITEQTNVLALNAAIQAASAGDAGRGFTVVAEEVQRLAERSAEATKQIAAIVKTIQTDTQDAVSAMENSTRGVVEGAKLADAAGQALSEISSVSTNLAQLIENISSSTQKQAVAATTVAESMKGILEVTDQTTEGTKVTAVSIGELADLAAELKGSVSGFKV